MSGLRGAILCATLQAKQEAEAAAAEEVQDAEGQTAEADAADDKPAASEEPAAAAAAAGASAGDAAADATPAKVHGFFDASLDVSAVQVQQVCDGRRPEDQVSSWDV